MKHDSVLKHEVIEKLNINPSGIYVDATLGLGGHSQKIIEKLNKKGKLICFDQDENAIKYSTKLLSNYHNIIFIKDNFRNLEKNLNRLKIEKIDGIIYDLGTSYYQLTDINRGFTYHNENIELDMRMDQSSNKDAKQILSSYSKEDLERIFKDYGDEKFAKKIALKIVKNREVKPITTNTELNEIIKSVKGNTKDKHPSKQVYQALRIEVNDEINAIKESIIQAADKLKIGGEICVITFHSLEDKTVKDIFWKLKNIKIEDLYKTEHKFRTLKSVYPSKEETVQNNSARSAKLRILVKNYE